TLIIDCDAFRPLSSFVPENLTEQEYERYQARERLGLILQCVGRALRGDESKTACVILIRSDAEIMHEISNSDMIQDACTDPLIIERGEDIGVVLDQCKRWLEAGGGLWPLEDLSRGIRSQVGRPKRDLASLLEEAILAKKDRVKWRDFARRFHL